MRDGGGELHLAFDSSVSQKRLFWYEYYFLVSFKSWDDKNKASETLIV